MNDKEEKQLKKKLNKTQIQLTDTQRFLIQNTKRLNSILFAIRNINHLITTETNSDRLIQQACELLVDNHEYSRATILLFDDTLNLTSFYCTGNSIETDGWIDEESSEKIKTDLKKIYKKSGILFDYSGFIFPVDSEDNTTLTVALKYNTTCFGIMSVCLPDNQNKIDKEEQNLFEEVGFNIAFALHDIALTKNKTIVEKQLNSEQDRRVRELNCLQNLSFMAVEPGITIEKIIEETVNILPFSLRKPKGYYVEISYESQPFYSRNFKKTNNKISFDIVLENEKKGFLNLYIEDSKFKKEKAEINEESNLIKTILAQLTNIISLKKIEEQFFQSQKMKSIGSLAGGIAHDFNNLLTVIIGYSQMLKKLTKGEPEDSYIQEILNSGLRAQILTRQLLAFSRKQILHPEEIDLNKLISDMQKMLHRLIYENIKINTDFSDNLKLINADLGQLEQVIMNVVVNSSDAMRNGGKLIIKTKNVHFSRKKTIESIELPPGDYVCISIIDNGTGIEKSVLTHIFEPFFTTKENGTGLGLSTVYGIIRQTNGMIDVKTKIGEGTSFNIYLPTFGCKTKRIDAKKTVHHILSGNETILLAEDEKSVRDLTKEILLSYGYKVITSKNGSEALECCKSNIGKIDLLLTDVIMPGMNGAELAVAFREICQNARVLFMSGYTDDVIIQKGIDNTTHIIQKPFTPASLALKLREMLTDFSL